MKQCTCFALKAINCVCSQMENKDSFIFWFYGEQHRKKYQPDHPAFLAAQEAWDMAFERGRQQGMKQEAALQKLSEMSQEMGAYASKA